MSKTIKDIKVESLKRDLKMAQDLLDYYVDSCNAVGEELAKHSFKYDGKAKNLVIQALELNKKYEELLEENRKLKDSLNGNSVLNCLDLGDL